MYLANRNDQDNLQRVCLSKLTSRQCRRCDERKLHDTHRQNLIAVTLAASLAAGTAFATGAIKLPDEVRSSSIKLPRGVESRAEFAKHARLSQQQAEAAALAVQPGQVVKAKLDDEDGYLVWQIDVKHERGTTEIAVDAGNGKALAAEAEEDDDHGHEHEDRNERG